MEWVVEEDARRILLSSPPGAVCERSISSCRFGATARGRAPGTESPLLSLPVRDVSRRRRPPRRGGDSTRPGGGVWLSPPLAPSQGCEQGTTSAETTGRRHEAGARDGVSPPLAPSQGCEQETTSTETRGRRHEAGRPSMAFPPPLAPSQGCEQGTTMAVP